MNQAKLKEGFFLNKLLSSEYLAYLDKIDFMIIVINKDENIHFINETACKITGYERDELKGKNYFNNLIPENIRYEIREVFRSIISNRISFLEEGFNPIIAKDGTIKNILWSNKILKNNKGEITGTLSTGKLIAEQESYEYANMNIVSQLLSILNSIDQAIYVADFDTYEILYANPVIQRLFNDQLIGKKCHKVLQNIDEPCSFCTNDLLRKNKNEPYIWEWQNLKLKKDYLCIDRAIKWANNKDVRFELAIDITRNKQIERDLARKLNYEKALSDISNLLTISLLKKESITEALSILISSFNACRGYVFENIESPDKGLCMQQIHYTYNEKKIKKKINNPVRQEIPYHPDLSRIRKELENNKAILSKINEMKKPEVDALQASDTKVIYIIPIRAFDKWYGFARIDICDQEVELTEEEKNLLVTAVNIIGNYIERKISVNALKDEKERLSITLRSIGDGVIALNEKACITLLNKAAESLTGWKEKDAIGKNLVDVFCILNDKTRNPIDHPVKNIIESDQIINLSNSILVSKDGSERYISYTYAPKKTIIIRSLV
ncbi:MAG: PAS domain-containing protein [Candidatus Coatesbacteria bacterium]|nr:PAS domain-containing protein [Candidatus Coatesbacteria bacterium]